MDVRFLSYLLTGLIYLIPGVAMITVGVFQMEYSENIFVGEIIQSFSSLVIAAGIMHSVLGLYGIVCSVLPQNCGRSKKETLYMVLGLVLMIVALVLIVAAFMTTHKEEITLALNKEIGYIIDKYPGDGNNTRLVNSMQQSFRCCGFDGPDGWQVADTWSRRANASDLPDSCCIHPSVGCGSGVLRSRTSGVIFTDGCASKMFIATQPLRTASALLLIACVLSILVGLSVIPCLWSSRERNLRRTEAV